MPYITKVRFQAVQNNPEKATEPGDRTALYATEFARIVREKGVRWSTYHFIGLLVQRPEIDYGVLVLTNSLRVHTKETDLLVSRQDARNELNERVFKDYEKKKRLDPENIDPYSEESLTPKVEA